MRRGIVLALVLSACAPAASPSQLGYELGYAWGTAAQVELMSSGPSGRPIPEGRYDPAPPALPTNLADNPRGAWCQGAIEGRVAVYEGERPEEVLDETRARALQGCLDERGWHQDPAMRRFWDAEYVQADPPAFAPTTQPAPPPGEPPRHK